MRLLLVFLISFNAVAASFIPLDTAPLNLFALPLMGKGEIQTSDGISNGEFSACANTEIIEWDSAETLGIKCVAKPVSAALVTVTKSSSVTLLASGEDNVICDSTAADRTLTLPTAVGNNGVTYHFNNVSDLFKCTIDADGTETIGGELNVVMQSEDDGFVITSNNVNWVYLSDNILYVARYTSDNGQALVNAGFMEFEDIDTDPHSTYNTSTGVWTAPIKGCYRTSTGVLADMESWTLGNQVGLIIEVEGVDVSQGGTMMSGGSQNQYVHLTDVVCVDKDDEVKIEGVSSIATNISATGRRNFFSIIRIE